MLLLRVLRLLILRGGFVLMYGAAVFVITLRRSTAMGNYFFDRSEIRSSPTWITGCNAPSGERFGMAGARPCHNLKSWGRQLQKTKRDSVSRFGYT